MIAGVNAPQSTVVSGDESNWSACWIECGKRDIAAQRLSVSHAFHSPLMQPAVDAFREFASRVGVRRPARMDFHAYRRAGLRHRSGLLVRAGIAAGALSRRHASRLRLRVLMTLLKSAPATHCSRLGGSLHQTPRYLARLAHAKRRTMLTALGKLYEAGREIDWVTFNRFGKARRVPLPTYPFEPHRYWLDQPKVAHANAARNASAATLTGTRMRSASDEAIL